MKKFVFIWSVVWTWKFLPTTDTSKSLSQTTTKRKNNNNHKFYDLSVFGSSLGYAEIECMNEWNWNYWNLLNVSKSGSLKNRTWKNYLVGKPGLLFVQSGESFWTMERGGTSSWGEHLVKWALFCNLIVKKKEKDEIYWWSWLYLVLIGSKQFSLSLRLTMKKQERKRKV